jgi:hypothetical protein
LNDDSSLPTRFGLSAKAGLARQTDSNTAMDDGKMILFLRSMISSFDDGRRESGARLRAVAMHK